MRGGYFTFKTDYIQPFPVPDSIPTDIYKSISETVDSILKMKAENIKNDTTELEKAIDKCIYSLYKLSKEDVAIIENDDIELLAQ